MAAAHAPDPQAARPIVIGTGPCGLFAGLVLAQMGFRPILLERGKVVRYEVQFGQGSLRGTVTGTADTTTVPCWRSFYVETRHHGRREVDIHDPMG